MIAIREGSLISKLLYVLTIAGEFPMCSISLFGSYKSHIRLIRKATAPCEYLNCKTKERYTTKLLTIVGKGSQKSLRMLSGAYPILEWLGLSKLYAALYGEYRFTGKITERERMHRVAEGYAMSYLAGIEINPMQIPQLQMESIKNIFGDRQCYYGSKFLKSFEKLEMNKNAYTRIVGAVFSNHNVYAVYNTRGQIMKWSKGGERKALINLEEISTMNAGVHRIGSAILFGKNSKVALDTLNQTDNTKRLEFSFDAIYSHIHFIPLDAIAALNAVEHGVPKSKVPITFHEFAMYYFEKYRKRKVAEITYENDMYRYKKHIQPYFKSIRLIDITPMMCQDYLDELAKKSTKTSSEVHSILNIVFKNAIAHGIIVRNPLAVVLKTEHTSEHGVALSKEEEKKLLDAMKGTKYEVLFAVALYTGMRPNEYQTAVIEGDFIKAVNSKRKKKGKVEYKKIPITTMLRPYLNGVTKFEFPMVKYMRDKMNSILPDHILYDLRTTFYTRCEECGVAEPARDHFVGHSRGVLNKTYSDLSDEYLLQEGKKLVW